MYNIEPCLLEGICIYINTGNSCRWVKIEELAQENNFFNFGFSEKKEFDQ